MRWYRPLYLSKNTADQIDKIREKAAAAAWVPGIYFVTLSSEPGHLLDLFHKHHAEGIYFQRCAETGYRRSSTGTYGGAAHGGEDRKG